MGQPGTRELVRTGIGGLDFILGGGLPGSRLYLVQGDPGVGKTTLGLQFLLEGVNRGEPTLYVTLSETRDELESVAESHGWKLDGISIFELSAVQAKIGAALDNTFFRPSEVELNQIATALLAQIDEVQPRRLVFDSLSELRLLAESSLRYRRQILYLKQHLVGKNCTVMFLDDRTTPGESMDIESLAHGVIALHRSSPEYGVSRRRLNVHKVRGVKFREGYHDLTIQTGGMVVYPRLVAAEHPHAFKRESFACGITGLDGLLGGGLDRGTSTMLVGPPGTGKSTLAMKFLLTAAERGEPGLLFSFDETLGTLLDRGVQLGMDLRPHIDSGKVKIQQINSAEITPGEMATRIVRAVNDLGIRFLVIDSINGYLNAMPEERHLDLQLHEVLSFLNQQGVITIMVLAQHGIVGTMHTPVDLTYLADTVVLLRYFEDHGSVKQAVSVIKKRSGNHERTIRAMSMDAEGIRVTEPLTNMQGVLTGVPNYLTTQTGKLQEAM